jgi:uncharacterized membrane protein
MLSGTTTLVKLLHSQKALSPIVVIPLGIIILVKPLHP